MIGNLLELIQSVIFQEFILPGVYSTSSWSDAMTAMGSIVDSPFSHSIWTFHWDPEYDGSWE